MTATIRISLSDAQRTELRARSPIAAGPCLRSRTTLGATSKPCAAGSKPSWRRASLLSPTHPATLVAGLAV
jgi:hypothetical protein